MKRYLRDFSFLLVYFPYRWLIQILPFQISYKIATVLGNIQYLLLPSRWKQQIATNMDLVFGNKLGSREKKPILRRFYINKQKRLVDLFILERKDRQKYLQACSEEGQSHIDKVLSWGKGVIILTFHFGSVNLITTYLTYRGYKITSLQVLPTHIKGASLWVSQQIQKIKSSILKKQGDFQIITSMKTQLSLIWLQYQYLSQNQLLDLSGDAALGQKFIPVDFFNVKLKVPVGPAFIAAKSGASIIPSFAIRRKDNAQHFVFREPIKVESDDEEVLRKVIQEYTNQLEYYVSQYPDYWAYWTRMEVEGFENGTPVMRLVPEIK